MRRAGRCRTFALHLKKKRSAADSVREANETNPIKRKEDQERKLTAIEPGMNRFQWDLRYPDATEVNGFEPPIAAGGLTDEVSGPVVTPGTYTVTLSYGATAQRQSFAVALDPRIHATNDDLAARLGLQLKIHAALDTLDTTLNRALAVRDSLAGLKGRAGRRARKRIAALNDAIDGLVQLDLHSSEGTLLHEALLRSHIAYLAADVDLAYARPTPAQYAVYQALAREAHEGEARLTQAMGR